MTADVAALVAAAAVMWTGRVRGWLTPGAGAAAAAVGLAVWAGTGPAGLVLLLIFFVSSSLLTRIGTRETRGARSDGGPRTARQVLANGGVAAAGSAAGAAGWVSPTASATVVLGALATATADTWASEVGRAAGGPTRLLVTGRPVSPGASGGVSWAGSAAGIAGALVLGGAAALLGFGPVPGGGPAMALLSGVAGTVVDSILGGTVEQRLDWWDNDLVNGVATAAGAAAALALSPAG